MNLSGSDTSEALIIRSKTDVQHPEGYLDWVKNTLHGLGILSDIDKTHADVTTVDSSNVDEYLAQYGISGDFQTDVDNAGAKLDILRVFDFNTGGLHGTFNTFATSQANAKTRDGKTNAWAGAIATAVFNTTSNAELVGGSVVNLTGADPTKNNVLIKADTVSEMWIAAALMSMFNYKTFFSGTTARDGDSAGGSIAVQVGDIDTIAKIGENAVIQTSGDGVKGNVEVLANENGEYVNTGNGTSAADNQGKGGDIAVTVLAGGETKAYIDSGANVNAKNVSVGADKDDVLVHGLLAYVNADDAVSFGITTIAIDDSVEAFIKGSVVSDNDVLVNAAYDKIFVNAILNAGNAKNGDPQPQRYLNPVDVNDVQRLEDYLNQEQVFDLGLLEDVVPDGQVLNNLNLANNNYVNPDRSSTAYAGNILLNVINTTVKSYIADGAKITAGNDVTVSAISSDINIEVASILAVKNKSGGGASVTFDLNNNNIQSYIGAAEVDADKDIKVSAEEDNLLIGISAGIGKSEDSSGVGVVSLDIQKNNIEASIKDGAKINTKTDKDTQSVSVAANLKNKLVKLIGALSIQSEGNEANSKGAKGAAVDGDVALNTVKAYIQGADVNASNKLDVAAEQDTTLVDVSVSGAVSTNESAYDGTVAVYVSSGETDAYISDTKINKTQYTKIVNEEETQVARENKGVATTVSVNNKYDNVTVTGTVTGADSTAAGGSFRIDWIADDINSYIEKSVLDTTGSLSMKNDSLLDNVAITVAGQASTSQNAYGGSVMLVIDDTVQNNYVDDSTVNIGSLDFDSDSTFKTVGVTGAVTAATQGRTIGGSLYLAVADNDINTYIANSGVTSTNDIDIASDYALNNVSVIFAGSGGRGAAGAGSVDTIVNNSNSNTYISYAEDSEKTHNSTNVTSTNGKVKLKGTNAVGIKTINGSIAISLDSAAIGAAINTVVENNDLLSYIDSATISAKNDLDIATQSDESIMSISIGGAGGTGITAAGSINTMVIASDINAFIKNSVIVSESKDVKVSSSGNSEITGGTGVVEISTSGTTALGATIVTGVINNSVLAYIENSKVNAGNDVAVSATANEAIGADSKPFITVAGGYSEGLTADGVVDTMIINSTAKSEIKGTKQVGNDTYGITAGNDVTLSSNGQDTIFTIGGAVGASTEYGIGATINTVVVDKSTITNAENTIISAKNISATSSEKDNFFTTMVAASGAGTAGGSGVINTNVITSNIKSMFKNSTLTAANDISINSDATADMQTITGAVSGGGTAGVGLSAVNDVINYHLESSADTVTATFDNLNIDAQTDNKYSFSTVSGAGGGDVALTGVENVNYINNSVKAYATGILQGNNADISATDKVTFTNSYSGVVGGAGMAGIGATVEVNEVTSTVLAYIGGSNVNINDIDITANGEQNFNGIFAAGFDGAGFVSGAGTVLVNNIETTVKAYVEDNTTISPMNGLNLTAQNDMNLTEYTGAVALGLTGGGIGATVVVNNIKNTVEAYIGESTNISAKDVEITSTANNNLGKSDSPLIAVSGAGGLYAGIAGTVMYTSIEDTVAAYVGSNNTLTLADSGSLDISANDTTTIYTGIGGIGAGGVGVGASVGYTDVQNTVIAFVGSGSNVTGNTADISITANSNESANAEAIVVAAGAVGLEGGVLYNSFGKQVGNASYNELSDKDKENYVAANTQRSGALAKGNQKAAGGDNSYKDSYNALIDRLVADNNTKGSRVRQMAKKTSQDSLYTKAEGSGSSLPSTKRDGTTSAYVDTSATINANNLTINAQNTDNVNLKTYGDAFGMLGVGISAAISDEQTTTNAFVQNSANINVNSFILQASSNDTQNIEANAAAGGIQSGSGSITYAVSNKTTNSYINKDAIIQSVNDLVIGTTSTSDLKSASNALAGGALSVGVSSAKSKSQGNTKIDIGDGVSLTSTDGLIQIATNTTDSSNTDAEAATGSLVGGTGGEAYSLTGKDSTINIGANFSASSKGDLTLTSTSTNTSTSNSDGRAYGGISAGGTKTTSEINQTSGVKIADAASDKNITSANFNVSSTANNTANANTYAGMGAAAGIAGSGVYNNITSTNDVSVGNNYNVTADSYNVSADTVNTYKGYNKSDAVGFIAVAIPFIENTVNSTVSAVSNSNIESKSSIIVQAANEIEKTAVDDYDLYGGSGGLADGSGGHIHDYITMTTSADFGGKFAHANGKYGNGAVDISAYNIANINEKADLYSQGGISGADMDSMVDLSATATTTISNGGIESINDNTNYVARNDIDIYTKCNVESYGGVAGAGGNSSAVIGKAIANVIFNDTAKSTSGRDTNISAISNKSVEAYMYARTRGAFSVLNDQANAKSNDSEAKVTINGNGQDDEETGNAVISAYDSINVTAQNTSDKIKASRDSKAYQIWCIPITGTGRAYTNNAKSGEIIVNGILKSGKGFNKSLTIDKDGTLHKNGIDAEETQTGTISPEDIEADIKLYEESRDRATEQYNACTAEEQQEIQGYKDVITNQQTEIANRETDIGQKNTDISNYYDKYKDKSSGSDIVQPYLEAANAYWADVTDDDKRTAYINAKNTMDAAAASLSDELKEIITHIEEKADIVTQDYVKIVDCNTAIKNAQDQIDIIEASIKEIHDKYIAQMEVIREKIRELVEKEASGEDIPVFSIVVDDVIIRNGEINFNGDGNTGVNGNGWIKTPGNNASITVVNNSISNLVFNKLSINGDYKGGVNFNGTVKGPDLHFESDPDKPSVISITNTVDKNDPTVHIDTDSNAGDIVLMGIVENPYGSVEITNYTGNVISQGGITANDLHIRVPNGGYEQQYTNSEQKIGGSSGTGAIVASGDIVIAAKTIDINGLIKSGTEIKEVNIPELTVIKKDDGKYYQKVIVGGVEVETEMPESTVTDGYYYLTLANYNNDLATLRQIKAYFKPDDPSATGENISGDIYLFKADTAGGNITLTGNITNSNGNGGKIELLHGYGHINVVNDSVHDLIVSALNADTNNDGILTINDFKLSSATDTTFDDITQTDLTTDFLKGHGGIYTAQVIPTNDTENTYAIKTTAEYITDGNGSWSGKTTESTTADGATRYSTTYTPGDDAYVITKAEKSGSYERYVQRSWWTEFWYGKLYETVYFHQDPEYGVKQNPIAVNFVGFDKPEINIISNGISNVVMDNNISAMSGDVNIKTMGNILTNSVNYAISGNNITLTAGAPGNRYDIGENVAGIAIRPIQLVVYNDGLVNATGKNVYLNYPKTDISNIILNADDYAYLATDNGIMDIHGKSVIGLKANELALYADRINLNPSDMVDNGVYSINVSNWSANAKDDIYIENRGDIIAKYIVSENNKDITLVSKLGKILAGDTGTYSDYNIIGGNVNLIVTEPEKGIGTSDKPLRVANPGIYYVVATDDIYLDSGSRMYIDRVTSGNGNVNLTSKFGIIASEISTDIYGNPVVYNDDGSITYKDGTPVPHNDIRHYNISSEKNINLMTETGNIENIFIDTNGILNASAGYNGSTVADATSDVHITFASKAPTQEEIDKLKNKEITFEEFISGYKNMTFNNIKAGQNVTLSAERNVSNSTASSSIEGDSIVINAVGDVGSAVAPVKLTDYKEVAVYTKSDSSVYLDTDNDIRIRRIDVTGGETDSPYAQDQNTNLDKVFIVAGGNIFNAGKTLTVSEEILEQSLPNIRAEYISLVSGADIGDYDVELYVQTPSMEEGKGLAYSTPNGKAYIKGIGDLKVLSGNSASDVRIVTEGDDNIIIENLVAGGDFTSAARNTTVTGKLTVTGDSVITAINNIVINEIESQTLRADSVNANITKLTIGGDTLIATTGDTTIGGGTIGGDFTNTAKDTIVTGKLSVTGDSSIVADNNVVINEMASQTLYTDSATANITKLTIVGDTSVTTTGDTTIGGGTIGGDFTNTAQNTTVVGKLAVTGDSTITATNNIAINEIESQKLTADSDTANITKLITSGDTLITTTGDTTIGNGTVGGDFTNTAKNATVTGKLAVTGDSMIAADNNIVINEIVSQTLIASSETVDITKLTTGGDTLVNTTSATIIVDGMVGGDFTNIAKDTTITGKLDVTGDSVIVTDNSIVINEISSQTLTADTITAHITKMTTGGDALVTTTGDTKIGNGTVGGNFTNTAENTTVTGKLAVTNNATINAENNIQLADIETGKNLNTKAININIDEIKTAGIVNSVVDNITMESSNDINLGSIQGNTSVYTNQIIIETAKSVKNGIGNDDTNITAANIEITAGDSIGEINKAVNMYLADVNTIDLDAANIINVTTQGGPADYDIIIGKDIFVYSKSDIRIGLAIGDTLTVVTKSTGVDLNALIKQGKILTADKRVVIDNESLAPDYYATAQIYSQEHPMHLGLNASDSIDTNPKYVSRHADDIFIRHKHYNSSMEIAITEASEANIKNTNIGRNSIDKTDKSLNETLTISDYISNIVYGDAKAEVTNFNGEDINELNIMDAINTLGAIQAPEKKEDKSKLLGYNKK